MRDDDAEMDRSVADLYVAYIQVGIKQRQRLAVYHQQRIKNAYAADLSFTDSDENEKKTACQCKYGFTIIRTYEKKKIFENYSHALKQSNKLLTHLLFVRSVHTNTHILNTAFYKIDVIIYLNVVYCCRSEYTRLRSKKRTTAHVIVAQFAYTRLY